MNKTRNGKITDKEEKYIRSHTDLTVAEIAKNLSVSTGKIYYFIKKNKIVVKSAKNSVKELFQKLEE